MSTFDEILAQVLDLLQCEGRVSYRTLKRRFALDDDYLEDLKLGVSEPTSPLPQMDPQIRRRRTLEAIKRLLVRESLNQPLLLIFEDLHWLDNETQAFLDLLSESVATARLLLLVNYRPEYRHEWGSKTYCTQLRLDPLGREEAQELLTALVGDGASLQPLKQLILTKTEGNPFFMEEIVQAVLTSRIDRLPPEEKALLQTLAVIGKEFSLSLLEQVVEKLEEELHGLLSHLQVAEFIYEQPAFPEVEYTFKHALTQEVAYNSLLIERRRVLHERTAQTIEVLFHNRLEDHCGDLAHHYPRSGNTPKAVEYLGLAGQQAMPDTPERTQQELTLHLTLGGPLVATKGPAAPEVETTYTRARELCRQVEDTPQLFPVLQGLWVSYLLRAEYQTAHELGEQLLGLAQRQHDPALLIRAHLVLGDALFWLGELGSARVHLEQGITLYDPQQHRFDALLAGYDSGALCLAYAAWVLWLLGYPDQALKRTHEALTLAQELSYPLSLAFALNWAALLHQFRREGQAAQERSEAVITISIEQGFAPMLAFMTILRGWALAEQGQEEEGITQMRQGLVAWRAMGAELQRPHFLALLAEAYGKIGQAEEGLGVLEEALAVVNKNGERWYEAELYRLKGELTLVQSKVQSLASSVQKDAED